jgi:hypothetical protein
MCNQEVASLSRDSDVSSIRVVPTEDPKHSTKECKSLDSAEVIPVVGDSKNLAMKATPTHIFASVSRRSRAMHVPLTQVELYKLEGNFDNLEDLDKHIKHLQCICTLVVHLEKWDNLHREYPCFISVNEYFKIHSLIAQLGALVAQTQDPEFYRSR